MEYHILHRSIDNLPSEESRVLVIAYLKETLPGLKDKAQSIKTAYDIAGLMATDFTHGLSKDDPIDELLTIAGELEINPSNADELRQELIEKIVAL